MMLERVKKSALAVAGLFLAAVAVVLAWNYRRKLVARARAEIAWSEREGARLAAVRAEKLSAAKKDDRSIEMLGKRAEALQANAVNLRKKIEQADDAELMREMRRIGILVAFFSALAAHGAAAQAPRQCAPEVEEPRAAFLDYEGHHGLWLEGAVARCVVAGFSEALVLKEEITVTQEQLRLRSNQAALYQAAIDAAIQEGVTKDMALKSCTAALDAGGTDAWDVLTLTGLGFVVGAAAALAVAIAAGAA